MKTNAWNFSYFLHEVKVARRLKTDSNDFLG